MATMNRDQWDGSEAWRELVSPAMHESFMQHLEDARRDGHEVKRVILAGGTPIVYDVSE